MNNLSHMCDTDVTPYKFNTCSHPHGLLEELCRVDVSGDGGAVDPDVLLARRARLKMVEIGSVYGHQISSYRHDKCIQGGPSVRGLD